MSYITNLTIRLAYSLSMAEIASKIGRALDPDVGGHKSFQRDVTGYNGETPIYAYTLSTTTPCTQEFANQAAYMVTHPEVLHQTVLQDYQTRWPDFPPPTLSECEYFCSGIIKEPI